MSDADGGHVPIAATDLEALAERVDAAQAGLAAAREATDALLALADDARAEAARRLAERGASSAQVERLDAAHRRAAAAVQQTHARLQAALDALRASADDLTA